jgi:hypothetical protein
VRWPLSAAGIAHRWPAAATADVSHRRSRATTTTTAPTSTSTATARSTSAATSASSTAAPATSASGIDDARRCDQKAGGHGEYHKCIRA